MKKLWILAAFGVLWAGCKGADDTSGTTTSGTAATTSGAPETKGTEPMAISYSAVQEIFSAKCIGCHGENGKEDLDLRSYSSTMKGGEHGAVIKAGDPAGSKLLQMLKADPDHRMPKGMDALPADQIKQIDDWIAAGAKES
jgi:mono/diheme cytochrome c family protein